MLGQSVFSAYEREKDDVARERFTSARACCSSKTPQMCNFLAQLDVARASLIVCSSMLPKIVLLCSELDNSRARQSLYSSRLSLSVRLLPTMISCKYQTSLSFKSTIALAVQEPISRNYVVFKLAPNLANHPCLGSSLSLLFISIRISSKLVVFCPLSSDDWRLFLISVFYNILNRPSTSKHHNFFN